jgi:hypothetical protein
MSAAEFKQASEAFTKMLERPLEGSRLSREGGCQPDELSDGAAARISLRSQPRRPVKYNATRHEMCSLRAARRSEDDSPWSLCSSG